MPIEVEISDNQGHLKVDRGTISALVQTVLSTEKRESAAISIALVDNATIHAVNRTHLDHDWPTDVITFPLSDLDDPVLAGELVISTEMALSSGLERNVEPLDELALYVVHGLLHLCGYDDKSEGDIQVMRRREHELLEEAGLKNPFLEAGCASARPILNPIPTRFFPPFAKGGPRRGVPTEPIALPRFPEGPTPGNHPLGGVSGFVLFTPVNSPFTTAGKGRVERVDVARPLSDGSVPRHSEPQSWSD